jgi:hypothetical protein
VAAEALGVGRRSEGELELVVSLDLSHLGVDGLGVDGLATDWSNVMSSVTCWRDWEGGETHDGRGMREPGQSCHG